MATRVTISNPPAVQESARAVVMANRKRLEERELRIELEKRAEKAIKEQTGSIKVKPKKNKKDEWKGAIAEYKRDKVLPKRRWGKSVFSWVVQEFVERATINGSERLETLESNVAASDNILKLPSALEIYRFYDPIKFASPFEVPSANVLYGKNLNAFPDANNLATINIVAQKKDRLFFQALGQLNVDATSIQRSYWDLGMFFDARQKNKSSYVYVFAKKNGIGTSMYQLRNVEEGFDTMAGLDPASKYPKPKYIIGDPAKIFIERHEITKQAKNFWMNLSTDVFDNPTTKRIFEWGSFGNRVGTYSVSGAAASSPNGVDIMNYEIDYDWLTSFGKDVEGTWILSDPIPSVLNEVWSPSTGTRIPAKDKVETSYPDITFNPKIMIYNDFVEIVYTDKDYGDLVWQ